MADAPGESGGRVVAITGAAGGIGRALAGRYARAGARVALLDRDAAGAGDAAAAIDAAGGEALALRCDVTDTEDCRAAMREIEARWGGLDVLVNNAGITHVSPFARTDPEVIRRVMDVNFFGAVHCTRAALELLVARRGLVVVVSSVAGFAPLAERCAYAASKHALHGLFETLRSEERERGLGVLLVCPGFTRTGIEDHALGDRRSRRVYGRVAEPEAVAEAIYRAAERRQRLLVLSLVGRLSWLLVRLWPSLYERLMARRMRSRGGGG